MMTQFEQLMAELKELHESKAHDYSEEGNPYSNFVFVSTLISKFTNPVDVVFVTLIGTKLARLSVLLGKKEPRNESIDDTLRDLTNYCALWTSFHRDQARVMEGVPYQSESDWEGFSQLNPTYKDIGDSPGLTDRVVDIDDRDIIIERLREKMKEAMQDLEKQLYSEIT